jgi:hypothetical protein
MRAFGPRRPFRRIRARLLRRRLMGGLLAPGPLGILKQANRLFAAGQYGEAAGLYENLARSSLTAGLPRAPRYFILAARANWHAGQIAHGMDLLRVALDTLASAGAADILARVVPMAASELESLGHTREAAEVRAYAAKLPAWDEAEAPVPTAAAKPLLPTHCPQCGGIVRTDEVEWIDDNTAECAYCGSPIRPQ